MAANLCWCRECSSLTPLTPPKSVSPARSIRCYPHLTSSARSASKPPQPLSASPVAISSASPAPVSSCAPASSAPSPVPAAEHPHTRSSLHSALPPGDIELPRAHFIQEVDVASCCDTSSCGLASFFGMRLILLCVAFNLAISAFSLVVVLLELLQLAVAVVVVSQPLLCGSIELGGCWVGCHFRMIKTLFCIIERVFHRVGLNLHRTHRGS